MSESVPENPVEETVFTPERLGTAAAALTVVMFGVVGQMLFDDPLFGGLVGLVTGIGLRLLLVYTLRREWADDASDSVAERWASGRVHYGAAGYALAIGGVNVLAGRFAVDGYVLPFAVGGILALAAFVPLSYALPEIGD